MTDLSVIGENLLNPAILFFLPGLMAVFILKTKLDVFNAGAIAATYGSISAVTFITAIDFLRNQGVEYNGYMVAAMALMEAPAIITGLILINLQNKSGGGRKKTMAFAMRVTVPKANPGIYVPMSLAITFPLNIIIGIPVYFNILNYLM